MSTASAPVEIGRVTLTVLDLPAMTAFYQQALGLHPLSGDGAGVRLGADDRVLLELRGDAAARRSGPREAGLFHTAFLMPSRAALARWLIHAAGTRVPLQGASDHLVSEAIYLADPEGNGIEVYADRPRSAWHRPDGSLRMATEALDLNALASAADGPWTGAPDGTVVGHVHLQVGDVPQAEAFYRDVLGLPVMAQYPGASFYGSGGYHHHIATNIWNSRGAEARSLPATGLTGLEFLAAPAEYDTITGRLGGADATDPWGTPVTLRRKAA
jgi:catechol 2,3-dioxygenase